MANQQREILLALIKHQTPKNYQEQAQAFATSADNLKLSPITINHLFLLGQGGTTNQPYDIRNLANIEFSGIDYDVTGTSVTGQYYNKLSVRFKNKKGQEEHLGWTTASKLIETNKRAAIMNIPALMGIETATIEDYTRAVEDHDYAKTLEEAIKQGKTIQSTKEKRDVQHLEGLNNAIEEASKGLYKDFTAFLSSKDYFSENAMHYKELLLPTGGLVSRMQARDNLSAEGQEALILVTKHKKQLPTNIYAQKIGVLRAEDELSTLLDAEGHLKRYLSDLQLIGTEGKITGKPQEVLHAMQQLHEGKAVMSAPEILPFLMLYDVNGERVSHHEENLSRSATLENDYEKGISWLKEYFIDGPSWKGSKDTGLPTSISKELKGIVKNRADPHLKEVQELFRTIYGSETIDEAITKMSIREMQEKTNAAAVLERRKKNDVIVDGRQTIVEDFASTYNLSLDEFVDRMEDQYQFSHHKTGDWRKESDAIKSELTAGLYVDERFDTFKELIPVLRDTFIPFNDDEWKIIDEYHDLQRKTYVLDNHHAPSLYFSASNKYIKKADVEEAAEFVNKQGQIIRKSYENLEKKTMRSIGEHADNIKDVSNSFVNADLSNVHKVNIYGTTFQEKDDFKATFSGVRWNPDKKHWYIETQKVRVSKLLDKINDYNESHTGKLSVDIE